MVAEIHHILLMLREEGMEEQEAEMAALHYMVGRLVPPQTTEWDRAAEALAVILALEDAVVLQAETVGLAVAAAAEPGQMLLVPVAAVAAE